MEIYASWSKGLPESPRALSILRGSGIIAGVEMCNIDEAVDRVLDAGLEVSCHTPGLSLTLNLASPIYEEVAFGGEHGPRLVEVVRRSPTPFVGLHLGYSAERVWKMVSYPNVPVAGTLITDPDLLLERIVGNVRCFEERVNRGLTENAKLVLLETMDFSRELPVPWELQRDEARDACAAIDGVVAEHGTNAGILHVTEPWFVDRVLSTLEESTTRSGFLFDVAHNMVSGEAKIFQGSFEGTLESYFAAMLEAVAERTFQVHLSVPEDIPSGGYRDSASVFRPGNGLSDLAADLSREVLRQSPECLAVTLEMTTGLGPVKHAREMVRQAGYVAKNLLS